MNKWITVINGISSWSGMAVVYLILPMFAVPVIESIFFRLILNEPTVWGLETTLFIFGGYFMIGGAYGLLHKRHVSMDIVYLHMRPKLQQAVDILSSLIILLICIVLVGWGSIWAWESTMMLERTHGAWSPYIWPMRWVLVIAALLLAIQALGDVLTAILKIRGGEVVASADKEVVI
jgi:TRAP-type mannitol/chloroaromatic compound transport system permease small subunit